MIEQLIVLVVINLKFMSGQFATPFNKKQHNQDIGKSI